MTTHTNRTLAATGLLLMLAAPQPAFAYIGPGAGLGAIAVTVAFLLGIVLLLAGFVWYPIKRLLKGKKRNAAPQEPGTPE